MKNEFRKTVLKSGRNRKKSKSQKLTFVENYVVIEKNIGASWELDLKKDCCLLTFAILSGLRECPVL